jgi:hypothetical protein
MVCNPHFLLNNRYISKLLVDIVDVRGAYMNDNIQSREGLEVTDFPSNLPIYTGHFHKPHTV